MFNFGRLFELLGIRDAGAPTNGGVLVKSGSKLTTTTAGTAGQALTSNGAGAVPTFADVSGTVPEIVYSAYEPIASETITANSVAIIPNGWELILDAGVEITLAAGADLYLQPATQPAGSITESSGPTLLAVGSVTDGQYLRRSGAAVVGDTPASATAVTTGYIYGFPLAYLTTTTLLVGFPNANGPTSICRDKADAANITLAPGTTYTITITSNGAALGDDSFTGAGTAACNNGTTITGTSTTFKSSFVTRTATGTYSSSGTAVTGSGTKFLSEVAVNDLFGDATNGWSRITSIASDTALTLSAALPNGNASAGTTGKIIEQPTISITSDGASPHQVATIASDTSLTVTEATTGGSLSGKTYYIGRAYTRAAVTASQFLYVWLGKAHPAPRPTSRHRGPRRLGSPATT